QGCAAGRSARHHPPARTINQTAKIAPPRLLYIRRCIRICHLIRRSFDILYPNGVWSGGSGGWVSRGRRSLLCEPATVAHPGAPCDAAGVSCHATASSVAPTVRISHLVRNAIERLGESLDRRQPDQMGAANHGARSAIVGGRPDLRRPVLRVGSGQEVG